LSLAKYVYNNFSLLLSTRDYTETKKKYTETDEMENIFFAVIHMIFGCSGSVVNKKFNHQLTLSSLLQFKQKLFCCCAHCVSSDNKSYCGAAYPALDDKLDSMGQSAMVSS
jgi:hypothetical protein